MENVVLIEQLQLLFSQLKSAKLLVDDGKEVYCSRQLQGAKTRCIQIIESLKEEQCISQKMDEDNRGHVMVDETE